MRPGDLDKWTKEERWRRQVGRICQLHGHPLSEMHSKALRRLRRDGLSPRLAADCIVKGFFDYAS